MESLAWKSESPLWDAIKESSVPGCEDVVLPNEQDVMKTTVKHPAVIRVTETQPQQQQQRKGKHWLPLAQGPENLELETTFGLSHSYNK